MASDVYGGGLVGMVDSANIRNSYAQADVDGGQRIGAAVGGLIASTGTSSITKSYVTGNVHNATNRGGMVGSVGGNNTSSITNSMVAVNANGGSAMYAATDTSAPNMANNFFDATALGFSDRCAAGTTASGCTAVNTDGSDNSHFFNTSAVAPFNAWDFSTDWQTTSLYPSLRDATDLPNIMALTAPSAPQSFEVHGTHTGLEASWNDPASNGGATLNEYVLQVRPHGSDGTWTTLNHTPGYSTYIGIGGYQDGDRYDVRVAAVNALGTGDFAQVDDIMVGAAPGIVQNLQFNNGVTTIGAIWSPPADSGYSSIDHYQFAFRTTGQEGWATYDVGGTSAGVNGVDPGHYDIRVRAVSANGPGEWSSLNNQFVGAQTYDISTCQQLQDIQNDPAGDYTLASNVDCSDSDQWNDDGDGGYMGFTPITDFTGSLAGDGHSITGLYMNQPAGCNLGLFSDLMYGADVQNVSLTDVNITSWCDSGSLAGVIHGGSSVTNVQAAGEIHNNFGGGGIAGSIEVDDDGDVSITNTSTDLTYSSGNMGALVDVGGVAGSVSVGYGTVELVRNSATIHADNGSNGYEIGGLVGYAEADDGGYITVEHAEVNGSITSGNSMGGLFGYLYGNGSDNSPRPAVDIVNSTVALGVNGQYEVGGLIGYIEANSLDVGIERSSYTGDIEGTDDDGLGGLVGYMASGNGTTSLSIDRSFASGDFNGYRHIGGLVGHSDTTVSIADSYARANLSGSRYIGGLVGSGPVNIETSYAAGSINSPEGTQLGGLVGDMSDGYVATSFAAVNINSTILTVGGAIGTIGNGTVNVWVDAEVSGGSHCNTVQAVDGIIDYNCELVNQENQTPNYFKDNHTNPPLDNWNFTDTWSTHVDDLPSLQWGDIDHTPIYEITNCTQLQGINNDLGGEYTLENDIDCSGTENWNFGRGFEPIGNGDSQGFTGTLDGQNYTITGLTINNPSRDMVGLFELLNGAVVSDIKFVTSTITGKQLTGTVAGLMEDAGIYNISVVDGSVTSVGDPDGSFMSNATGGLAGVVFGEGQGMNGIGQSSFRGDVSGSYNVGGLAGVVGYNVVYDSYARANVTGATYVGGLIGNAGLDYIVTNYATGTVTATGAGEDGAWAGGLIGVGFDMLLGGNFTTSSVVVPEGSENNGNSFMGAMSGSPTLQDNYYDAASGSGDCAVNQSDGEPIVNEGCIAVDLVENPNYFFNNQQNPPLGFWDFDEVWMSHASDYPTLQNEQTFNISTCQDLQNINDNLQGHYRLTQDIDCSETETWNDGAGFDPIAMHSEDPFTGSLDGQGHTITGLYEDNSSFTHGPYGLGLFYATEGARLENFSINDSSFNGGGDAGAIAVYASNTTATNLHSNAWVITTVNEDAGGLFGSFTGDDDRSMVVLSESSFTGTARGNMGTGGLVGSFHGDTEGAAIFASSFEGGVQGTNNVGGLAGMAINGAIYKSYATGTVLASGDDMAFAGGLVGYLGTGTIMDSFAAANVVITDGNPIGGNALIGNIGSADVALISNNFYDSTKQGSGYCAFDDEVSYESDQCTGIDTNAQPDYFSNTNNAPLNTWSFGGNPWLSHQTVGYYPTFGGTPIGVDVNVTRTTTSITSYWEYPDNNGADIDEYQLRYRLHDTDDWMNVALSSPTATSATVTGLTPNTGYTFEVRAHNANGWSEWRGYVPYTLEEATASSTTTPKTPTQAFVAKTESATTLQEVSPEIYKTILDDFSEYAIGKPIELQLSVGQVIYFYVGGELHSATVKEIGKDYIILTIASTPFDVRLNVGETKQVSVLQNNTKDLSITLTSIENGKANVSFAHVTPAAKTKAPVNSQNNTAWWLLLFLIPAGYVLATRKDPKHKK